MLHCVLKGFNFPLITSLSKVAKFCGFHLFFVVGKLTKVLLNPRDIHYIWGIFSSNALLWLLFVAPVTNAPENRLNFDPSFFVCHMFVTKTHFRRITYTPCIFMTQFSGQCCGGSAHLGGKYMVCIMCLHCRSKTTSQNAGFGHNKCTLPWADHHISVFTGALAYCNRHTQHYIGHRTYLRSSFCWTL